MDGSTNTSLDTYPKPHILDRDVLAARIELGHTEEQAPMRASLPTTLQRTLAISALLSLLCLDAFGADRPAQELKAAAAARIDTNEERLQNYVRFLNASPEVGFALPLAADRITSMPSAAR